MSEYDWYILAAAVAPIALVVGAIVAVHWAHRRHDTRHR